MVIIWTEGQASVCGVWGQGVWGQGMRARLAANGVLFEITT